MDNKGKRNVARLITGVAIAGGLTGGALAGSTLINPPQHPGRLVAKLSTTGMFMDGSQYKKDVDSQITALYNNLRTGKINIDEFSQQYNYLMSEQYIVDYARTSNDPKIQEVVTKYDEYTEMYNQTTSSNNIKYIIGGTTAALLSGVAMSSGIMAQEYTNCIKEDGKEM